MEALESLHKKFVERKQRLSLNLAIAAEQVVSQGPVCRPKRDEGAVRIDLLRLRE
jgi:hypothetical protein